MTDAFLRALGMAFAMGWGSATRSTTITTTRIGIDDFIEAYADRTSQPDALNIFESPGWQVIDPSIIFDKENQEKEPKTKKRGKKSEVRFDG
jgi:hypothetical protein